MRSIRKPNFHDYLDEFKLRCAKAVLHRVDLSTIRAKSLSNMDRWEANGTRVSAHEEWRELMTKGTDADVIAAMTGKDQKANRLRQSAPYIGIIDEVTRVYLWETRTVEDEADLPGAFRAVDEEKRQLAENLLRTVSISFIRKKSLSFLNTLHGHASKLSPPHEEWLALLTTGSDNDIIAVMTGNDDRAVRLRLVNPFNYL